MFKDKLVKRGVSLKVLDTSDPKLSGKEYRLAISLKEGISQDDAKKIAKIVRDEGPKGIQDQVQGDKGRVSTKKRTTCRRSSPCSRARSSTSPCSSPTTGETPSRQRF